MAVSLNSHWRVPVGYLLINSLTAAERGSLLKTCLELMHDANTYVHSLTFNGANVNLTMCKYLGANFQIGLCFKLYIIHPVTKAKIFCIIDPSHMIKLVRNTFGDKKNLKI